MNKKLIDNNSFFYKFKRNWKLISILIIFNAIIFVISLNLLNGRSYRVDFYNIDDEIFYSGVFEQNQIFPYPDPPSIFGYDFNEWIIDESIITNNIRVYSSYSLKIHTVVFLDYDGTIIETQYVTHGEDAVFIGVPTRVGHTFSDWSEDTQGIENDIFIRANYNIDQYEIMFFDADGQLLSSQTINYGDPVVEPESPKKEEHIFQGWSQSFDNPTSNLTINPIFREIPRIAFVEPVQELNVLFGTSTAEVLTLLPQTTTITDSWDQVWQVELRWVLYEFNANNPSIAPGRFIVSGLFDLPEEVSRSEVRTQVDTFINVGAAYVSVQSLGSISLPIGSTLEQLFDALPDEAIITDSLGNKIAVEIKWEQIENFQNLMRMSEFVLEGDLILPSDIGASLENPANITVTVKVGN